MANNEKELINAIEIAINYDKRILVEKGIENAVEVNCSVILNNEKIIVSELEEPMHWESFLSFEDKYLRNKTKSKTGMQSMSRKIPAVIKNDIKTDIQNYSKKIYKAMDCKGIVRIDYILDNKKTSGIQKERAKKVLESISATSDGYVRIMVSRISKVIDIGSRFE